MPMTSRMLPSELVDMTRAIGPEHCINSTNFGQAYHPIAPEGFRMEVATLLRAGVEEVEVDMMIKDNPSRLLGL